jgi:hypothetical protein
MIKWKFSAGFSIIEFFFSCVILVILAVTLAQTLSYFSKSGARSNSNDRVAALSELLRSQKIALSRGDGWYSMTSSETGRTDTRFPNLKYDQVVFDIQDNARRVYAKIWRVNTRGELEAAKVDNYSLSPRPGSSHGAAIRLTVTKDDANGAPARGIMATVQAVEGTIPSQCVSDSNILGTDDSGQCTLSNVALGAQTITVTTGGTEYFFNSPFGYTKTYAVTTTNGVSTPVPVYVQKMNKLTVKTFERSNNSNDSSTPVNSVAIWLEGQNLAGGGSAAYQAPYRTGEGGNNPGEMATWVLPGWWRVTPLGSSDHAGLDFVGSNALDYTAAGSGFVQLDLNHMDFVQTYYLPRLAALSGHVYQVTFGGGQYNLTTTGVQAKIFAQQNDMRVVHGSPWSGGILNTTVPQSSNNPTWARYLNNTVVNRYFYGNCTALLPNCQYWPEMSQTPDSSGSYSIANVAPLIVFKQPNTESYVDFDNHERPERARVWTKSYPDSPVSAAGIAPIVYFPGADTTRANSKFLLIYSATPFTQNTLLQPGTNWNVYPYVLGAPLQWPEENLKQVQVETTNTNDMYLMSSAASNFLHIRSTVYGPDSTTNIFQGGDENKATLQLLVQDLVTPTNPPVIYNVVAYVTPGGAGANQLLGKGPFPTPNPFPASGTNQTFHFSYIVPPLGSNQLVIQYQAGYNDTQPANSTQFNLSATLLENTASPFTPVTNPNAAFSPGAASLTALSSLGSSWLNVGTSHSLSFVNGTAGFSDTRKTTRVYYKKAVISDPNDLNPNSTATEVFVPLYLYQNDSTHPSDLISNGTPNHRLYITPSDQHYLPVGDLNGSRCLAGTNGYSLTYSGGANPTFSANLFFVMQKHLAFAGYVYDTGSPTHAVPNPPVRVVITYKRYYDAADSTITLAANDASNFTTNMSACASAPCPTAAQYKATDVWVPMLPTNSQWQVHIFDPSPTPRYYDVTVTGNVTTDTGEIDNNIIQQVDGALIRLPGYGG